jgi:hypothetical protein
VIWVLQRCSRGLRGRRGLEGGLFAFAWLKGLSIRALVSCTFHTLALLAFAFSGVLSSSATFIPVHLIKLGFVSLYVDSYIGETCDLSAKETKIVAPTHGFLEDNASDRHTRDTLSFKL